jgi:chemotaxis protein histidine kinase CheA
LALVDIEWQIAHRQRFDRESDARQTAERRLAEALARAEAETQARQVAERLVRLAEARALTAEEELLLAEQLAQMAREEAEVLKQARATAETHRREAERKTEQARREAEGAAQARAEAEAEAQAAAVIAAQAQVEAQAARRALKERKQAEQAGADKLSEIVARIGAQHSATLIKGHQALEQQASDEDELVASEDSGDQDEASLQLAALSSDQTDTELVDRSTDDRAAAFETFLRAEQSLLEKRLNQSLRAQRSSGAMVGAMVGFTRVATHLKWSTLKVSDGIYVVLLEYHADAPKGHGYFVGGIKEVAHIRWQGDDIEILSRDAYSEPSATSWPPPPSDPALLAFEERLWAKQEALERSLTRYVSAHINEINEIQHKAMPQGKRVELRKLRLLDQAPGYDTVLVELGVYPDASYYFEFPLVVEISPKGAMEILGHRDYVAAEWQSAQVGG